MVAESIDEGSEADAAVGLRACEEAFILTRTQLVLTYPTKGEAWIAAHPPNPSPPPTHDCPRAHAENSLLDWRSDRAPLSRKDFGAAIATF